MKHIKESPNTERWPRTATPQVEARKRDLLIRIADWTRNKDACGYDVECYVGGVYDWHESCTFSVGDGVSKQEAKQAAIAYAQTQVAKLL